MAAMYVFDVGLFTNDLLRADFEHSAAPFLVGDHHGFRSDVLDGTYRVAAIDPTDPIHIWTAPLARTAYTTDLSADLVGVSGSGGAKAWAGLACANLEDGWAYTFALSTADGSVVIARESDDLKVLATARPGTVAPGMSSRRLRLRCAEASPSSHKLLITAYVDGAEVLRAQDGDGFTDMRSGGLVFGGPRGTDARFDNVRCGVKTESPVQ